MPYNLEILGRNPKTVKVNRLTVDETLEKFFYIKRTSKGANLGLFWNTKIYLIV